MNETQVIESIALMPNDQTPAIAQPREKTFHFSHPPVAAQGTAILRLGTCAVAAMRRDHLQCPTGPERHQRIGIVAAVTNQPMGNS